MKKNIQFLYTIILIVLSALSSCKEEYASVDNVIYFAEAQKTNSGAVTIDENGGVTGMTVRLAKPVTTDIDVVLAEDKEALNAYNTKFGTEYKLLPEKYYSLAVGNKNSEGATKSLTVTIKAGSIAADIINVNIKPFDKELSESAKYAIPLVLKSATGAVDLLKSSSTYLVLVNRVVVTNVCYLNNTNYLAYTSPEPVELTNWTFEWMVKMDAFNRNNVTQWHLVPNYKNGPKVYTRFGDVLTPQNQLQVNISDVTKHNSPTVFTPKKWYHMAITYDGLNIRLYVNGVVELDVPYARPGEKFTLTELYFSNNKNANYRLNGYCSELRMWSVARTAPQIASNMYTVDPTTEGLEVYWKCNEGEGKIIKDHSGNGRDVILPTVPIWVSGQRFPASDNIK